MKNNKYVIDKIITPLLLFICSLGVFSVIAHEVVRENEDWFDSKAFALIDKYSSPPLISIFKFLTFFGSGEFLFPVYIIMVAVLLYKNRKKDAFHVSTLAITSTIVIYTSKLFFARPRPDLPLFDKLDLYSFPSGHSMGSFVFVSILIYEIWEADKGRPWKWQVSLFLLLATLAIGLSRIVLRYHYASYIAGGFSLGFAYVLFYFWMQKKWRKPTSK